MAEGWLASEVVERAFDSNPTLSLLRATNARWILPLFSEHLEFAGGPVSADWFHEKVADARARHPGWQGEVTPVEHSRNWIDAGWLQTDTGPDGRTRYRLSPEALRALRYMREVIEGENTVSGARLGSIAYAVRLLADMTDTNREVQVARIEEQIRELERRKDDVAAGRVRLATVEEMKHQLREILSMTASLPADFRHLRSMVEDRHQDVARDAMVQGPTKADLVERYLQEHDLLSQTPEGRAYRGFARLLTSRQADVIRDDIEQILRQDFAVSHMTSQQRTQLDTMLSTLLAEELIVQTSYVRWTASLRRLLTRTAHGRHGRLLTMADRALNAGAEWAKSGRGPRAIPDVLGIGTAAVIDITQTQLWRDRGPQTVEVLVQSRPTAIPEQDRESLRVAAGMSIKAATGTVNRLLGERHLVTGSEAYEASPAEFQRLGTLLSLLDLAIAHGEVDADLAEEITLTTAAGQQLQITVPYMVFHEPLPTKGGHP